MAATIILSTAYGIEVQLENDPYVDIAEKSLHAMACAGNPGAYLVDSLPICAYILPIIEHFTHDSRIYSKAYTWVVPRCRI